MLKCYTIRAAQSVYLFAMGWTVRGSNSVRAKCSTPSRTGPGAYPAFITMGTLFIPGVKWPERGVDHPPHLVVRLREEYDYTPTPPLGLRGFF
jgi:hypothetical protein